MELGGGIAGEDEVGNEGTDEGGEGEAGFIVACAEEGVGGVGERADEGLVMGGVGAEAGPMAQDFCVGEFGDDLGGGGVEFLAGGVGGGFVEEGRGSVVAPTRISFCQGTR